MFNAIFNAIRNLFSPVATMDYPANPTPKAEGYRGLIEYEEEKCIYCMQCEEVCPPNAIVFDQDRETQKFTYHYNPYLCIYCTECVRACPDKASALSQSEKLIAPAGKEQEVNERWFGLQKEAKENRDEVKKAKTQAKLGQNEPDRDCEIPR